VAYFCSFLHIQRPFFKPLCSFVLSGGCSFPSPMRLRGGGTRPPDSKPDQTRSPGPNPSPIGRGPQSPSPRTGPDWLWTRGPESRGGSNWLWTPEPESKGESDCRWTCGYGVRWTLDPRVRSPKKWSLRASLLNSLLHPAERQGQEIKLHEGLQAVVGDCEGKVASASKAAALTRGQGSGAVTWGGDVMG
jgi:hypothetical protein